VFSISVETRAGVTRHHLDSAIDALAVVEHMQKETNLPIIITNRARGHVLTVEELSPPNFALNDKDSLTADRHTAPRKS
jgi:hypothetical protein